MMQSLSLSPSPLLSPSLSLSLPLSFSLSPFVLSQLPSELWNKSLTLRVLDHRVMKGGPYYNQKKVFVKYFFNSSIDFKLFFQLEKKKKYKIIHGCKYKIMLKMTFYKSLKHFFDPSFFAVQCGNGIIDLCIVKVVYNRDLIFFNAVHGVVPSQTLDRQTLDMTNPRHD